MSCVAWVVFCWDEFCISLPDLVYWEQTNFKEIEVLTVAPIRVLHCVAGLAHGGYESLIMNLYRCIDRQLVQFDFLSSFPGVYEEEIRQLGGVIHSIPFITQKGPFSYTHGLNWVLTANPQYPIVHSHMDKFSGLVMRQAHRAGIPVRIAHSHNTQNEGGLLFHLVKNYYGSMVLPHATHLMACSKAAADWMFGSASDKAFLIHNGIDPERFSFSPELRRAKRQELGLSHSTLVFGHVGRFTAQKNHLHLLDTFQQICTLHKDSVLLLVGTGQLEETVRQTTQRLGLSERVQFLGAREDVPQLLLAMDCFVFPSLHEGLPVTLVEAQATGLPILASDAITDEVCITPLVHRTPLTCSHQEWAKKALALAQEFTNRHSDKAALGAAGYDIHTTAQWLTQFYLTAAEHSA